MQFNSKHKFDSIRNRHYLNNVCSVIHCHHYATLYTQLAEDASHFEGEKILKETSENIFYRVLHDYFTQEDINNDEERRIVAEDYWRIVGMGLISFEIKKEVITAEMFYSHIDEGWLKKWGSREKPVNHITAGFVAAVAALVNKKPPQSFQVQEIKGLVCGDNVSAFEAIPDPSPESDSQLILSTDTKTRQPKELSLILPTNIDRISVIKNMSQICISPNNQGIIEAFSVYVQQLPADFWNIFARNLINNVSENLVETAEFLLINAAHECGYHTGHGIINSDAWNKYVSPMIKQIPEDILHGAFAVFTAWGWAMSEIIELIPGEKMIVRAYDYYEADLPSVRPSAYMIQGVCAGFMDLAYGGEYDPAGQKSLRTFKCNQTKGIETGDDYGEFVVTPK
ncbi:hypothetical protein QUF76_01370 [Desulfobacterales bacterium HSG16]|nr:hypothetical protein [Desulfobacterales bacterium HSG16]